MGRVAGPIWILFGSVARRAADRLRQRGQPLPGPRASGGSGSWPSAAPSAPAGCSSSARRSPRRSSSPCSRARSPWCWLGSACRSTSSSCRPTCPASATSRCAGARCSSPASASALAALLCGGLPAAARVRAEPRPAARREPRVHRAPALGPRRARGGADGARARAPHRLGAAAPELPEDARRGSGLRHPGRLHLPDRARGRRTSTTPARSPGSTSPSWSGSRTCRACGRWGSWTTCRSTRASPTRASFRPSGRARPAGRAAGFHLGRGRLLLDHGDPAARGPGVHRGGPAHRPGPRDHQPVGGEPALAGAVGRSGGGSSGRRFRSGRPSSAWWKT